MEPPMGAQFPVGVWLPRGVERPVAPLGAAPPAGMQKPYGVPPQEDRGSSGGPLWIGSRLAQG
jgi:hypothetical protein